MNKIVKKIVKQHFLLREYSAASPKVSRKNVGPLLISCKRSDYNHYYSFYYDKLDEVPLASKGWTHSKAKGDFFTINPFTEDYEEITYSFSEFGIREEVIEALKTEGINHATDFQNKAFEAIGSG